MAAAEEGIAVPVIRKENSQDTGIIDQIDRKSLFPDIELDNKMESDEKQLKYESEAEKEKHRIELEEQEEEERAKEKQERRRLMYLKEKWGISPSVIDVEILRAIVELKEYIDIRRQLQIENPGKKYIPFVYRVKQSEELIIERKEVSAPPPKKGEKLVSVFSLLLEKAKAEASAAAAASKPPENEDESEMPSDIEAAVEASPNMFLNQDNSLSAMES